MKSPISGQQLGLETATIVSHGERGARDGAKDGSKKPKPTLCQRVTPRSFVSLKLRRS